MSGRVKRKAADAAAAAAPKKARAITKFFSPSAGPSASKFDKEKWISNLSDEEKSLLRLEIDTMHDSWLGALKDEITKPTFLSLKRFLASEQKDSKKIYPPEEDIYSWTRFTPLNTVKVVILGQDPYHGPNQAMGLSFSVRPPTKAPPSLKNMYIALKHDYPSFNPPPNNGGLLTPWADRGVLMLNACLTVRATEANSHSNKGWETLTQRAIEVVAEKRGEGVVFMAWGAPAAKRVVKIDKEKHLVLNSVHPSPLSAHRGFFDCGHFRKANEWLELRYGEGGEIDWSLDGNPVIEQKSVQKKKGDGADVPAESELLEMKEDEFDADEEEAMIQAVVEAEEQESKKGKGKKRK